MPNPNTEQLAALLSGVKTIAVVGAKDKPGQPVDRVGRYLVDAGYDVIPVHPKRTNIWGLPTFPTLAEVDRPVDLVNLFRAPQFCADHARETLQLSPRPRAFWMQLGIRNPEAEALLAPEGVTVIQDLCIMIVHRQARAS